MKAGETPALAGAAIVSRRGRGGQSVASPTGGTGVSALPGSSCDGSRPSRLAAAYSSVRVRAGRPTCWYLARTRSRYSFAVCGEIPIRWATAVSFRPEAYSRSASSSRGLRSGVSAAEASMAARSTDRYSSSLATVDRASMSWPYDTRLGTKPSAPACIPDRIATASS